MTNQPELAFGVDIGGSGIKAAPVDLTTGLMAAPRFKLKTPQPASPEALIETVGQVIDHFEIGPEAPIGVAYPGVVIDGVMGSAANLDKTLIGLNLAELVARRIGRPIHACNDADAAGFAEIAYGAARGRRGTVLIVTLGTGIGTALVRDGVLVPNTELGHIELDGHDAETQAASSAKDREDLSWKQWAKRLQRYFEMIEFLLHPDLIVVGGGVSREHQRFLPQLQLVAELIPAELRNGAGIAGAAALAVQAFAT